MMALIRQSLRTLTPAAWGAVAVLIAFLIFGAYCAHQGADSVRDRQAAEALKVERRASSAKAAGASVRAAETTTITQREKDLTNAVQPFPDAPPSPSRVALTCERLRQQGTPESVLPGPCRPGG